jgi:hypothetical protein
MAFDFAPEIHNSMWSLLPVAHVTAVFAWLATPISSAVHAHSGAHAGQRNLVRWPPSQVPVYRSGVLICYILPSLSVCHVWQERSHCCATLCPRRMQVYPPSEVNKSKIDAARKSGDPNLLLPSYLQFSSFPVSLWFQGDIASHSLWSLLTRLALLTCGTAPSVHGAGGQ